MLKKYKYEDVKEIFLNYFTKEACQNLYKEYLLNWIAEGYIGKNLNIFEISVVDRNTPKDFYVDLLIEFFLDKETFQKVFKTLDDEVKLIFKEIVWKRKFKMDYPVGGKLPKNLMFFKAKYSSISSYIYLDDFLIQVLRENMEEKPKDYYLYDSENILKNSKKIYKSNSEIEFLTNLKKYVDFFLAGEVLKTSEGKILKETKKNMLKHFNVSEYYGDLKGLEHLKVEIISLFLAVIDEKYVNHKYMNVDNMKNVVLDFLEGKIFVDVAYPYTSNFLTHLKGYRNIWENEENHLALQSLFNLFKEVQGDWCISIENIVNCFTYRENNTELLSFNEAKDYIYINEASYERARIYDYEDYTEYVIEPFVKSLLFLLGTLGLFEIYYEKPKNCESLYMKSNYLTKFDGLKFVKLTDLGKFILGKTDDYTLEKKYEEEKVFLDEKQLLVTVIGDSPTKRIFFDRISKKIGENLYKINSATFKKGLVTKEDLLERIEKFKENVDGVEIPNNWKEFFDEYIRKFDSIKVVSNYTVFKLPEDKELIDLVLNNSKIRELVLKAEDYHLLVDDKNIEKFKKLLGETGYYFNS